MFSDEWFAMLQDERRREETTAARRRSVAGLRRPASAWRRWLGARIAGTSAASDAVAGTAGTTQPGRAATDVSA